MVTSYEVINKIEKITVAQCASLKAAERKATKLNNEYGAMIYRAVLVIAPNLKP